MRQVMWRQRVRDWLIDGVLVVAVALLLSACGGGSTGSITPTPGSTQKTPLAVVNSGATVSAGTSVVLDGSASSDPAGINASGTVLRQSHQPSKALFSQGFLFSAFGFVFSEPHQSGGMFLGYEALDAVNQR